MMKWLTNLLVKGYVQATKFITTGGTSSQFVKGDGSLDDTQYVTQTEIDSSIDDIEIGGRNLLLKSNKLDEIIIPHTTTQLTVIPIGNDFKVESTGGSSTIKARIDQVLPEPFAGEYTCSFYIKNKSTKEIIVILRAINTTSVVIPALYEGFISFTRVKNTTAQSLLYFITDDVANNLDFEISPIKLEKGNKATDWTPAPEDQVTDWDETNPDSFAFLKNKPTTFPPSEHTHTWGQITDKPSTIGGYGITDFNSLGDARWALRTRTITGTGSLTGGGNLTANRTLDLTTTAKSDIAKGVTAHGWGNHSGLYFGALGGNVQDLDSLSRGSAYKVASAPATSTGYSTYGSGFTMGYNNDRKTQLHLANNGLIQSRHMIGGVWQDIETVAFQSWVNAQGFLTGETDPTVPSHVKAITTGDITNWNTAYDWTSSGGVSRTSALLNSSNDLDLVVEPGYYHHSGGSAPLNTPTSGAGYLEVVNNGAHASMRQTWRGRDSRLEYQRTRNSSGVWSDWVVYYNSDNFNPSDYALASHNHDGIYEPVFSKNTAFNKNFGTSAGTVTEGNDSRLSNSREWTAQTVSAIEASTGTATTRRAWTAIRVRQAVLGWWNTVANGNINQLILGNGTLSTALTASKLWGRGSTGNMGAISLGNGLQMDGNTLKLTGGTQDLNTTLLTGNTIDHKTSIDVDIDYDFAINRNGIASNNDPVFNSHIKFHSANDSLRVDIRANNNPNTHWDSLLSVMATTGIVARTFGNSGFGISTFDEPIDEFDLSGTAWLRSDKLGNTNKTFQFPNKSGTLALEEDIDGIVDDKINEYFGNNPVVENLTYPLIVVVDDSCFPLTNNARYLFTGSASEVCILADPEGSDEGKEILILNDTGASLTPSISGTPMRILTSILGSLNMPAGYKGRFRVIEGELVEIG